MLRSIALVPSLNSSGSLRPLLEEEQTSRERVGYDAHDPMRTIVDLDQANPRHPVSNTLSWCGTAGVGHEKNCTIAIGRYVGRVHDCADVGPTDDRHARLSRGHDYNRRKISSATASEV